MDAVVSFMATTANFYMSDSYSHRRVVITGMGVVSPLGNAPETLWNNLLEGQCGIDTIKTFDVSEYACQIAGEVLDLDPVEAFPSPKEIRRTDRYAQFGIYAGYQALKIPDWTWRKQIWMRLVLS